MHQISVIKKKPSRNIIRSLWNKSASVLSRLGALFLGNLIGAGLGFAILILLTRALTPEEYGRLAPILTLLDITQVLVESAIIAGVTQVAARHLVDNPEKGQMALKIGFILRVGLGVLISLSVWATAPILAENVIGDSSATPLLRTIIFGIVGLILYSNGISQALLFQQFYRVALLTVTKNGTRIILLGALFFAGIFTLENAIWAIITATGLTAIISLFLAPPKYLLIAGFDRRLLAEIFAINGWAIVSAFGMLGARIDIYLLAWLSSAEETAYYSASMQISTIVVLFSQSIASFLFPSIARYKSRTIMRRHFRKMLKAAGALIILFALIAIISQWFVPIILGQLYAPAVPAIILLIASSFATMLFNPIGLLLFPLGEVRVAACSTLIQLFFRVLLNIWIIPIMGAEGAAMVDFGVKVIVNAGVTLVIVRLLWRKPVRHH